MTTSKGRYDGLPLLRLLEYYVLWAIGELADADAARLVDMGPKLNQIYGSEGSWQDAIAKATNLPPDMPEAIRRMWAKNTEIARANKATLTPQHFAEMFVDKNWRS